MLHVLELIETLWNVNTFSAILVIRTWRINRNIVECKLSHRGLTPRILAELIETLWNVNVSELVKGLEDTLELIETLWNVNRFKAAASLATVS